MNNLDLRLSDYLFKLMYYTETCCNTVSVEPFRIIDNRFNFLYDNEYSFEYFLNDMLNA